MLVLLMVGILKVEGGVASDCMMFVPTSVENPSVDAEIIWRDRFIMMTPQSCLSCEN
jgi:hypothetical protein